MREGLDGDMAARDRCGEMPGRVWVEKHASDRESPCSFEDRLRLWSLRRRAAHTGKVPPVCGADIRKRHREAVPY